MCYATNSIISKWDETKPEFWQELQEQIYNFDILPEPIILKTEDIIHGYFKHVCDCRPIEFHFTLNG